MFVLLTALLLAAPAPADSAARSDSAAVARRPMRRFPIEVRAPLGNLVSVQTEQIASQASIRALPVDGIDDVVALKAGVVAQGGEIHVRGGRAGDVTRMLDGIRLEDSQRARPIELPLLAVRSAELVTGGMEAEYGGALAGVLTLRTVDPGARWNAEWRWETDARLGTHFDRVGARASGPIPRTALGVVAAADMTLDDTALPALHSNGRTRLAGMSFGWRAENRMLGYLALAPVRAPQRASLKVIASRVVHEPYDAIWTLDGFSSLCRNDSCLNGGFSDTATVGYDRYRAADHHAITDERRVATLLSVTSLGAARKLSASLGWLHARSVTSVGGRKDGSYVVPGNSPLFGADEIPGPDPFHVYLGDDPLYRKDGSDDFTLRADADQSFSGDRTLKAGLGLQYHADALHELDGRLFGTGLDSLREYRAYAPGAFAYAQGRWFYQGLFIHGGLRAEYFTAGPQAEAQSLAGDARGHWSLSPRLGMAYPISVRDVFSLTYVRLQQDPVRDVLYDNRVRTTNRQPIGDPAIAPATVISYQTALKHLLSATWAFQGALFYRDLFGQVGARDSSYLGIQTHRVYTDADEGHALGVETSVLYADGERSRFEAHYTWLQAYGNESLQEGDPYGVVRGPRGQPIFDRPLSWDRRHTFVVTGEWHRANGLSLAWSTVAGSGLPWTPKPRRELVEDLSGVNSRRFKWDETTNAAVRWSPRAARGVTLGLEARNLFDHRGDAAATVNGYPASLTNTVFDDYGAYRTQTGLGGGAYWDDRDGDGRPGWVPVHDPRLLSPPREIRASIGATW